MALEGKIYEKKLSEPLMIGLEEKPTDNYLKECHVEDRICSETRQEAIGLKEGDFKWISGKFSKCKSCSLME